jgi:hypothetical protein
MKPHIKTALYATGGVLVVVAVLVGRMFLNTHRLGGGSSEVTADLFWLGFFGVVATLGLSYSWWRVFRDQAERERRPKPLNFD